MDFKDLEEVLTHNKTMLQWDEDDDRVLKEAKSPDDLAFK